MTFPPPVHVRTQPNQCACGRQTWNPCGACDPCLAQRDDEGHAQADHYVELYGWTGDRWEVVADEYDRDTADGAFAEEGAF